jgi:uncharacterized protein (TIGR02466 family)
MYQITPFSSTLWVFNLGYNYEAEIETCYKIKKTVASVQRSNVGGYQSDFINLIDLFPCISKKLFPVLDALAVQYKMQGSVSGAWLNINPKHTHNVCHTHSDGSLSGVMYLSTNKKSGDIVFYNPAPIQHYPTISQLPSFSSQHAFTPENGDVIVFPSYLEHCVMPNLSDEDRISIAFNIL